MKALSIQNVATSSSDIVKYVFFLSFLISLFLGYVLIGLLLKVMGKSHIRMAYQILLSYLAGVVILFLYLTFSH